MFALNNVATSMLPCRFMHHADLHELLKGVAMVMKLITTEYRYQPPHAHCIVSNILNTFAGNQCSPQHGSGTCRDWTLGMDGKPTYIGSIQHSIKKKRSCCHDHQRKDAL